MADIRVNATQVWSILDSYALYECTAVCNLGLLGSRCWLWVVNVSTPSGECLSMWPLHGAPPAPKSTSAGMKWKQQGHGRCRYILSAASLDCFSECSKQLVFNVLSQEELEKQIAKADEIYSDDD